ncbi:MAG: hypothetical protein LAP86_28760 [Acidobacteriia bacterium]|nr:hypothetical protein [Terriglobia bacterium]
MGTLVGVLIGLLVGTFGFLVMRNPMRLALLSWQKGYYQRMVLDTTMRNQLRVLGVLLCLFGTSILAASLGSALRVSLLTAVSEGLWVLMGLIFFAAWGVGLILAIRQLIKGELFNWWRMWKVSAELGPIDVFPPVTLKMQREARFFTIALLSLALISVAAALFHRLA